MEVALENEMSILLPYCWNNVNFDFMLSGPHADVSDMQYLQVTASSTQLALVRNPQAHRATIFPADLLNPEQRQKALDLYDSWDFTSEDFWPRPGHEDRTVY